MTGARRWLGGWLGAGVLAWLVSLVSLVGTVVVVRADEPVLHEYVPDLQPNEVSLALGAQRASATTVTYRGEVLRSPTFRPDRITELEGTLDYYEAFNPAITPFKRMTSLDEVRLDGDGRGIVLGVRDARRREVPVETPNAAAPDLRPRDRFWGDVLLDFTAGARVPLPSVAPDSRILSIETTPEVAVRIERDGADNYFVRALGAAPPAPVRLSFLTDAPRSYFGTEVPALPLAQLAGDAPELPPSVARRALSFAHTLGLGPHSDLRTALHALTRHFRGFEESAEPPVDTGDTYTDLVHAKKGVCRHRAYGFVVTAQALGIAARFLQNEAHSWVEVKLPGVGFMRVDLGGAAHGLTAHGTSDRPSYAPVEPDRLPRPLSYEQSYSTLGAGVTGLRPAAESVMGRWVAETSGDHEPSAPVFSAGPRASSATPARPDGRAPITLTLAGRSASVLRGKRLVLGGRVTRAGGQGVAALRIEISLSSNVRAERMLLGVTATDDAGNFRAAVGIPPDLRVGDYRLIVLSPGSAEYLPVVAQ